MSLLSIGALIVIVMADLLFLKLMWDYTMETSDYVIGFEFPIVHAIATLLIFFSGWLGVAIFSAYLLIRYNIWYWNTKEKRWLPNIIQAAPIILFMSAFFNQSKAELIAPNVFIIAFIVWMAPMVLKTVQTVAYSYAYLQEPKEDRRVKVLHISILIAMFVQSLSPLLLALNMKPFMF